jgi:sarcosine oxidase
MHRAYALWRELERIARRELIHITGIAEIGPADGQIIRGTLAAAIDLPHQVLDAQALMRRYPAFKLPQSFVAVLQPDGGYIEASAAIESNIRIATAAGAEIRSEEKVLGIEPSSNRVRIKTDRAVIDADGVIIAAGPWLQSLMPEFALPLRVTRQVVGWFEPDGATPFTADCFPVFMLESEYGIHYGFPVYGRMGIKVAKHHHLGESVEPDSYDRTVSAKDVAAIRPPLAKYLPGANGRLLAAQTCLYTMTPDETFIVDRMPGFSHVVVASPCSGHGFKFSPVIGEIVADLVTRGTTQHDISPFRLERLL